MIIDTSAWVEFSRHGRGRVRTAVLDALRTEQAMTTDVVRLELLAGVSAQSARATSAVLASCEYVMQRPWIDVDTAVGIFRACQRAGETIRSPNDCLIAAIAIRTGVPVLHRDKDFDAIARHSELEAVRG